VPRFEANVQPHPWPGSMISRTILCALATLIAAPGFAQTAASCDCTRIVGQCEPSFALNGNELTIDTGTNRCARFTWYDGDRRRTTVIADGVVTVKHPNPSPLVRFEECSICGDTAQNDLVPNTPPSPVDLCLWSGTWRIDGGREVHSINGQRLIGSYEYKDSTLTDCENVTFRGTIDVTISADGTSATGTFSEPRTKCADGSAFDPRDGYISYYMSANSDELTYRMVSSSLDTSIAISPDIFVGSATRITANPCSL
jgi:hypothetical protein